MQIGSYVFDWWGVVYATFGDGNRGVLKKLVIF